MKRTSLALLSILLVLSSACGDSGTDDGIVKPPVTPVEPKEPGEPKEPKESEDGARTPRRMTVEQLAQSIQVVTGGLKWEEDFGDGPVDMLEVLSPTLGVPDYLLVTEENLEPSLIIAKFMQDASHRICTRWVEQDRKLSPAERTLVQTDDWDSLEEAGIKANLRALVFRFFSRYIPPDDDLSVSGLYDLFVSAALEAPTSDKAADGWLAVCLALMTDPEFVIY